MLLPLFTCHWPFLPQTCICGNSAQKQICLMSWPIEAIAEINVWSDFCRGRQLVATYFYVSQEEGGAGLVSWGTLSGSDGAALSGEKARVSSLPPSACGTDQPRAVLPPDLYLPHQCQWGAEGPPTPSHPSATCSTSPSKISSFRPALLGYWDSSPSLGLGIFPSPNVLFLGNPVFGLTAQSCI